MIAAQDRYGIIAGGTWCADHNKLVDRWPGEEEQVMILDQEVRGGGPACNLAVGVKRLDPDLPVATIGLLGDDADGHILKAQAQREGLDCSGLVTLAGCRTTFTDAFTSEETGRRTHLYYPGASGLLTPDHFDFDGNRARILHLGLPGLHEQMDKPWNGDHNGWVTVLKKARKAGIKTNLEMCSLPAQRLVEVVTPCLGHLDYLIINDFEVAALANRPVRHGEDVDPRECLANAKDVFDRRSMELLVVHFPRGAIAMQRGADPLVTSSAAVPKGAIAGSNGAGDAFASGILYGMHQGWPLRDALQLAHACAAASMRHIGTTDGIERWQDCLALARGYGSRAELELPD
ncbi:MAG: carbohydrate kinase family protein [Pseudomonadota bacterium]|nr:carbohydrate kinase family protein [Pseudomonadota bacterium]